MYDPSFEPGERGAMKVVVDRLFNLYGALLVSRRVDGYPDSVVDVAWRAIVNDSRQPEESRRTAGLGRPMRR